ncbi:hypothetical protein B0J14DRAFT_616913 [Halenospora varia]|nr:hypothetical protein B0J14DRAFT_616913 [Halenospora varia]
MASERSEILLLSLAFQNFLDDTYSSLIDSLDKFVQLKRAKSSNDAIRYLEANSLKAILVTDEGLTETRNRVVLEKVQFYIQNRGLVIFGLHFPNATRIDVFDKFFDEGFGLPWQHRDYYRATFYIHEKIFVPVPEGTTQSLVFPPSYVNKAQAAVVSAKIGDGFLVYSGDVNAEQGSDKVILALCGL